jgi:hypothetical protein
MVGLNKHGSRLQGSIARFPSVGEDRDEVYRKDRLGSRNIHEWDTRALADTLFDSVQFCGNQLSFRLVKQASGLLTNAGTVHVSEFRRDLSYDLILSNRERLTGLKQTNFLISSWDFRRQRSS